mgnify:FL=1|jgi:hypothetical protein
MRSFSNFCTTLLLGLGLATSLVGIAHANDPTDAPRDSIIQGVRDDVRRKIKEREHSPPVTRPEAQTTGSGSDPSEPAAQKPRKNSPN